jgi:hypothetical protein
MKVQDEIVFKKAQRMPWLISVTSIGHYHLKTDISVSNAPDDDQVG